MKVKMYHNPKCSKSRQTLSLLMEKGIEPEIIEYLNTPPNADEITTILGMLDKTPREIMRTKESVYKEKNLDDESLDETSLISAMISDPILIERPIVIANGKAAIGRPPENVLDIL
jgi:arsenate reductase